MIDDTHKIYFTWAWDSLQTLMNEDCDAIGSIGKKSLNDHGRRLFDKDFVHGNIKR
jgi:hypothetical protein